MPIDPRLAQAFSGFDGVALSLGGGPLQTNIALFQAKDGIDVTCHRWRLSDKVSDAHPDKLPGRRQCHTEGFLCRCCHNGIDDLPGCQQIPSALNEVLTLRLSIPLNTQLISFEVEVYLSKLIKRLRLFLLRFENSKEREIDRLIQAVGHQLTVARQRSEFTPIQICQRHLGLNDILAISLRFPLKTNRFTCPC